MVDIKNYIQYSCMKFRLVRMYAIISSAGAYACVCVHKRENTGKNCKFNIS